MKKTYGFTIIELVVIIVLLSILAANVLPRFTGSSTVEPYTYRTQLIAALRLTQQRAMQQTNTQQQTNTSTNITNFCHQIVLDNAQARYGIPDRTDCAIINFPSDWQPDATGIVVESGQNITFSLFNSMGNSVVNSATIQFDNLGRPLNDPSNNCQNGCEIQISGNESIRIKIESEGYIHAI